MAYEFKKLSDVDTVETPSETANVLIEEDGIIKKAPKTAVGGGSSAGGSSDEYDMVIHAFYDEWKDFFEIQANECEIISGTFEQISEKMTANEDYIPKVLFRFKSGTTNYTTIQFNSYNYTKGSMDTVGMFGWYSGDAFQLYLNPYGVNWINFPNRQN